MKRIYQDPELDLIWLAPGDVIVTSAEYDPEVVENPETEVYGEFSTTY